MPIKGNGIQVQTDATNLDAWASDGEDGPSAVDGMKHAQIAEGVTEIDPLIDTLAATFCVLRQHKSSYLSDVTTC